MKLKEVTIPPVKERRKFIIEETGEEFDSKFEAVRRLKEIRMTQETRYRDFRIAEHLFGWKWDSVCGNNYLMSPDEFERRFRSDDSNGKRPGFPISGILGTNMSDPAWNPPNYSDWHNITTLIAALARRGVWVNFAFDDPDVCCSIVGNFKSSPVVVKEEKEKDYWSDEYMMGRAIQKAVFRYLVQELSVAEFNPDKPDP